MGQGPTFIYGAAINALSPQGVNRIVSLGINRDVDTGTLPEDVWRGASLGVLNGVDHKIVPRPTGAVAMEVVSDSASDAAAGTGARVVLVTWLDAAGTQTTTSIALTGTTAVAMPANVWRVNNLIVPDTPGSVGSALTNVGNISVRAAGGAGSTYAFMGAGSCLAHSSLFTVPASRVLDLMSIIVAVSEADTTARRAEMSVMLAGPNSGRILRTLVLPITSASTPYRQEVPAGVPINVVPAKTDVWLRVDALSASNAVISGGLFGWTRPADYFAG